jgi:hypothetical protein
VNPDKAAKDPETIVCRVTPWFYRRMGILAAMLLFMGGYFLYDGKIGYRKDNAIAEEKVKFDGEFLKSFDDAKSSGRLDEWMAKARAEGKPTGENGEPPKWASYAAQRGWPEQPKKHSEAEIFQQFEWGGAMLLLALVAIVHVLLTRGKQLTGHEQHMIMPNGAEVRFADVFRVDKRKWDNKGLAYVYHRTGGVARRAVVDDLKYDGAGRVLDRLLERFNGELIEKIEDAKADDPSLPIARHEGLVEKTGGATVGNAAEGDRPPGPDPKS